MEFPEMNITRDNPGDNLLVVQDIVKYFPVRSGVLRKITNYVKAVDGVSFSIKTGETFGLVGESGCGKTTIGLTVMQIEKASGGKVFFEGKDLFALDKDDQKAYRRAIQFIFQDPFSSLDPRMTIGESVGEGLLLQGMRNSDERQEAVASIIQKVGLESYHMNRYPHEFSGGQQQRIGIARALVVRPKFIICDEPVSALDVSVQSQILNLLKDLQQEFGLTYMFIAHNLGVVEYISDRIGVMYLGKLFEVTDSERLFKNPLHPYTQALLSAIPVPDPTIKRQKVILPGEVPSPVNPPSGCRFHPRCEYAKDLCRTEIPPFEEIEPGHHVACWLAQGKI
jgi:oligopeptide/dipeptide ABC transporter ATP-binding protein